MVTTGMEPLRLGLESGLGVQLKGIIRAGDNRGTGAQGCYRGTGVLQGYRGSGVLQGFNSKA